MIQISLKMSINEYKRTGRLAYNYCNEGKYDDALAYALIALENAPNQDSKASTYHLLGIIYYHLNQREESIKSFYVSRDLGGKNAQAQIDFLEHIEILCFEQ